MLEKSDSVDRMRIASPCPMNWDEMKGDSRARFCDHCSLHVYNISEMTSREVKALIADTEGRICGRLYKRADGTVITKDCPVGLRAIRRRVTRVAGATVTAVLSLCVSASGKSIPYNLSSGPRMLNISRANYGSLPQYERSEISGRVVDQNGEPIESARVKIINQDTGKKSKSETKRDGTFRFSMLSAGRYTIEVEASYFSPYQSADIELGASDTLNEDITLMVVGAMVGVIVIDEPGITNTEPGTKSVFREKQIRSLPF